MSLTKKEEYNGGGLTSSTLTSPPPPPLLSLHFFYQAISVHKVDRSNLITIIHTILRCLASQFEMIDTIRVIFVIK